jgi:hypothetical protein
MTNIIKKLKDYLLYNDLRTEVNHQRYLLRRFTPNTFQSSPYAKREDVFLNIGSTLPNIIGAISLGLAILYKEPLLLGFNVGGEFMRLKIRKDIELSNLRERYRLTNMLEDKFINDQVSGLFDFEEQGDRKK